MSQYIAVTDEHGKRREYRMPDIGILTVAQWVELCKPNEADGHDGLIEDLHRFSGIPKKHIRKLPPGEADRLIHALVKLRTDAEARDAEVKGEDFSNPSTIEHDGITYTVPHDLEHGTCFGQWVDLDAALEGITTEAEAMADICAAMLIEQGKEYEGLSVNLERMQTLPARVAMGLTAFFLGRSERLRSVMLRSMNRLVTSRLHGQGLEAPTSTPSTASGTD